MDEAEIDKLMDAYDSPIIETQNPVSAAALLSVRLRPVRPVRKSARGPR